MSFAPCARMLPKELRTLSKQKPHLWEYLHQLPIEKVGIPDFHAELDRDMSDLSTPNLIYPLSNGNFVHIFPDLKDARNYYISIEPGMNEDLSDVIDHVETLLVDYVGDFEEGGDDNRRRTELLLKSLDKVCVIRKGPSRSALKAKEKKAQAKKAKEKKAKEAKDKKGKGKKGKDNDDGGFEAEPKSTAAAFPKGKVALNQREYAALRYLMVRDKEGMGPLDPLIVDPHIEDISCSGLGEIFVEHKIFKGLKSTGALHGRHRRRAAG